MYFNALLLIVAWGALIASYSCGKSSEGTEVVASPTPTPPSTKTPAPAATPGEPKDSASAAFLVGSASSRFLVVFDAKGTIRYPVFDVKSTMGASGGIADLIKIDDSTYLAAFDPAETTKQEALILIDTQTGVVKNKAWYTDEINFSQISSASVVSGFIANTLIVATDRKILRLLHDSKFVPADVSVLADSSTLVDCPFSTIQKVTMLKKDKTKALLVLSSGANARLNLLVMSAGAPRCAASYDFSAAGLPTAAEDVPVSAVTMADDKIYVLYQSPTASKVVRYTFTGEALTTPELVFSDQTILGTKPKGLAARSALRLLVGNSEKGKIFEITTSGDFTGFFVDSSFTQDVSTIVTF